MIKNKWNWIALALGLVLVLSLLSNGLLYQQLPRTAYVDIHEVFEKFEGTKELNARLTNLSSKQKSLLDSMSFKLRAMQSNINENSPRAVLTSFNTQQNNYQVLNSEFTQQYEQQDQEYQTMVWKQINQYIQEYGKENGYDYIYGANGNGTMMYASDQKNITTNILQYINQRYEGL